jgi:phasin family protein
MGWGDQNRTTQFHYFAFTTNTKKKVAIFKQTLRENTMSPATNHDQSISVAFESIREFNVKMIDMAHANMEAFFGLARQLATAKAPSDILELWAAHARKQFETLTEQTKELTALGQKTAAESAEPIARSVSQAFKKAS